MLTVLVSWIILLVASLLFGYIFIRLGYGEKNEYLNTVDMYIMAGLLVINVYAEVVSIFYKLGGLTCILLALIGAVVALLYYFKTKDYGKVIFCSMKKGNLYTWLIILISAWVVMAWTVQVPNHYDTSLYHQQAIAWLEEYGVVPGLGNLHNRFAYNSAFMPLQALFSFKWLLGMSLHTVNGFLVWIMLTYSLVTLQLFGKQKEVFLSDLFKIATVIYIFLNRAEISSPGSDTLALLLVMYICIKWSEFLERECKNALAYTFVCILSIWAVTVKLSVAMVVLLAIYPMSLLLEDKQYKLIISNVLLGIGIAIPWLIRNVIISGYLLYPYPQLDVFSVDWKMPASVLTWDSREIMVWGRGLKDINLYEESILSWFPGWFAANDYKVLIIGGLISVVVLGIYLLINFIQKKKQHFGEAMLILYSVIGIVSWLTTAPLLRYGLVYLMIPICIVIALVGRWVKSSFSVAIIRGAVILCFVPMLAISYQKIFEVDDVRMVYQNGYSWNQTVEREITEGIKVWTPAEGDQCSYDVFPCVPYRSMLDKIELRGTTLQEGFRIKEQYGTLNMNIYGKEW